MLARWALAFACLPLAACASVSGFPDHTFDPRMEQAELAQYVGPQAIAYYDACQDKLA